MPPDSGVGVRLKVGGIKIEKSEGVGSGEGLCPTKWGSGGLPPEKKNPFCAKKNYAILSKFWYLFPILQHKNFQHAKIVTSASEKVGDYPPVLKVGGTYPPVSPPPAPTPMPPDACLHGHCRCGGGAMRARHHRHRVARPPVSIAVCTS